MKYFVVAGVALLAVSIAVARPVETDRAATGRPVEPDRPAPVRRPLEPGQVDDPADYITELQVPVTKA